MSILRCGLPVKEEGKCLGGNNGQYVDFNTAKRKFSFKALKKVE